MKKLISAAALIFAASMGQSVSADEEPLLWAGCGIAKKAFMEELAAAYKRKYNVDITLVGGGDNKGLRSINDGTADIGGACRPKIAGIKEESDAQLNPVAWDALVVITHKDNPVNDISLQQLRDLYDGKLTNWKELGGPDKPIELLVRKSKISGVGHSLRELVFHDHDHDFVTTHEFASSGPLEDEIEKNPLAVGVTGISSALKRNVKMLKLEGKKPSYDTIRTGEYVLYRPLYIVFNPASKRYREVKRFIDFAHSQAGREIIQSAGTVPYLDALSLVRKQREQWKASRELGLAQ